MFRVTEKLSLNRMEITRRDDLLDLGVKASLTH